MSGFTADNGLVVIPAREGSKRLPGKNLRPLGGVPLLAWSIQAARACPGLGRLFVSTDSETYAATARGFGAEAPFLRSAATSGDEASTKDVVVEAVDRYAKDLGFAARWIVILQPTSPFRTPRTIERGIALFQASGGRSVTAVARRKVPREWMLDLDAEGCVVKRPDPAAPLPAYYYCGAFYALTVDTLRTHEGLYGDRVKGLVIDDLGEALDIDVAEEWALAERLAPSYRAAVLGSP